MLKHQQILKWLLDTFRDSLADQPEGTVLMAPLPTSLFPGTIREPDLLYIAPENAPGPDVDFPTRIDLALDIVTPARTRDFDDKRRDYARAGIAEYWTVDPQEDLVSVLVLQDSSYVEQSVFQMGVDATSVLPPGLRIDVRAMLNA